MARPRCSPRSTSPPARSSANAIRRHRATRVPQVPRRDRGNVPADLDVHLVMDNYATHKTPLIRNWLARRPRWHVHLTPTSASWLNQVERFFALHHRAADQARHLSQRRGPARRHHRIHRPPQCRAKALPLDQISRRHPRFHRALLPLQHARAIMMRPNFWFRTLAPRRPAFVKEVGYAGHLQPGPRRPTNVGLGSISVLRLDRANGEVAPIRNVRQAVIGPPKSARSVLDKRADRVIESDGNWIFAPELGELLPKLHSGLIGAEPYIPGRRSIARRRRTSKSTSHQGLLPALSPGGATAADDRHRHEPHRLSMHQQRRDMTVSTATTHEKDQKPQPQPDGLNCREAHLAGTTLLGAAGLVSTAQTMLAQAQTNTPPQ